MTNLKLDDASYEVGHREGGSRAHADWMLALSEEFDLCGEFNSPSQFIEAFKAAYTVTPK